MMKDLIAEQVRDDGLINTELSKQEKQLQDLIKARDARRKAKGNKDDKEIEDANKLISAMELGLKKFQKVKNGNEKEKNLINKFKKGLSNLKFFKSKKSKEVVIEKDTTEDQKTLINKFNDPLSVALTP